MKRLSEEDGQPEKRRPRETAQQRLDRVLNEIDAQDLKDARACSARLDRVLDSVESEENPEKDKPTTVDEHHLDRLLVEGTDRLKPTSGKADSESFSIGAKKSEQGPTSEPTNRDGPGRVQESYHVSGTGGLSHVETVETRITTDRTPSVEKPCVLPTRVETQPGQTPRESPSPEADSSRIAKREERVQVDGSHIGATCVPRALGSFESAILFEDVDTDQTERHQSIADTRYELGTDIDGAEEFPNPRGPTGRQSGEAIHLEFTSGLAPEKAGRHEQDGLEASPIETSARRSSVDSMLERHPYLRNTLHFDERLHLARGYEKLIQSGITDRESLEKFAAENEVPVRSVARWSSKDSRPVLISSIEAHEEARITYERSLPPETLSHLIDSSVVYHCFRTLKDVTDPSNGQVTDCIERLCRECRHEEKVIIARLYPYHEKGPMWMRDVSRQIEENLPAITKDLNTRMSDDLGSTDIKLGIVGHKLYIRWRNADPYTWENLYSKENSHFKSLEDKKTLVENACSHLAIKAETQLSQLVGQLTDYDKTLNDLCPNVDLRLTNPRLKGETLHLISDVLRTPIAEWQERIDYVGRGKKGWGVIRNPNLDTDPVDVISRLVGIVMSDGHIDPNCHITYPDAYPDRLARVRETVNMLGDVDMTEKVHSTTGVHYIHIPAVVGRLLVKVGMLTGDKAIQDERLPEIVRTAPNETEAAYTKELTADDGCFAIDGRSGEFSWGRSIVLDAGNKSEGYEHKPLISEEEIEFVKTHGERKTMSFGGSKLTVVYAIQASEVKQLKEGGDPKVAPQAAKLRETIESNPPRLMEDERQLCRDIGIATRAYPHTVRVFEASGRVSVSWQAQTSTNDDAMVWGLIAAPNDARKSEKVSQWLSERIKILLSEASKSA